MSRQIEKKILPEYFEKILTGEKTFELRLADWQCSPGDTLVLNEIDSQTKRKTGRVIKKRVGYIVKTKELNLWPIEKVNEHGYQIISLIDEALL